MFDYDLQSYENDPITHIHIHINDYANETICQSK